ncbi:MAG: hypothetical protein EP329_08120 [Deltaproteobacteria bacterium]|nr:MAG: hypothetical protein EP329_08120 [Deltaproteobacteria bacterium]
MSVAKAARESRDRTPRRDEGEDEDLVTCFVSGEQVPRAAAVQVRIGPRQRVWMLPEYTRDWEPADRE